MAADTLPQSFDQFVTDTRVRCGTCNDRVHPGRIEDGDCPGCHYGGER